MYSHGKYIIFPYIPIYSHIFPLEYIAPARRALLDALEDGDERRALQVGSGAIVVPLGDRSHIARDRATSFFPQLFCWFKHLVGGDYG